MFFSTILSLSAIAGALALPQSTPDSTTSIPKCKHKALTFNIKIKSLLNTTNTNALPSSASGQFLVNVGGPAGFSPTASTTYTLVGGLLSEVGSDNFAAVKTTTTPPQPHVGDIMLVPVAQAQSATWPLISCTNVKNTTLSCAAGSRDYFQVCGKFVNVDPQANANCQDKIEFDIVPTCHF